MRLRQLTGSKLNQRRRLNRAEFINVLVITFNRTLRGYILELAQSQAHREQGVNLEVMTFAKWAKSCVGPCEIMSYGQQEGIIKQLLMEAGIAPKFVGKAGVKEDLRYFVDEVIYVLGRFAPKDYTDYLTAQRSGRGRAPVVRQELRMRLLDQVIGPYHKFKQTNGLADWNDLALQAAIRPQSRLDILVVDEAQDLSANEMRSMLAHLTEDDCATFIIDATQRIYARGFTWKELGLTIQAKDVYELKRNHRNTKQIAEFAAGVVRDINVGEDGVVPDPATCVRCGPLPIVLMGNYRDQIEYMLRAASERIAESESVAFLKPLGGRWFDELRRNLDVRNIAFCELARKSDWPRGDALVALCTLHSAKGLEFDHIMIPGLNQEVTPHGQQAGDGTLERLRRLLAMGIGRARKSVIVGYKRAEASSLTEYLNPETYHRIRL